MSDNPRLRERRLLQTMTSESCKDHPEWPVEEVWKHIAGAMTVLSAHAHTEEEQQAIVEDEYGICHASDESFNEQ